MDHVSQHKKELIARTPPRSLPLSRPRDVTTPSESTRSRPHLDVVMTAIGNRRSFSLIGVRAADRQCTCCTSKSCTLLVCFVGVKPEIASRNSSPGLCNARFGFTNAAQTSICDSIAMHMDTIDMVIAHRSSAERGIPAPGSAAIEARADRKRTTVPWPIRTCG